MPDTAEDKRLRQGHAREANWQRWGPYLAERQWGTVREDYSADGNCWDYFPFDQAASRAYRWGEDGILGITDRECRLCFALAMWNERDPILKERLYGLANEEGNHGEDVKECYYYLEATPTSSYLKGLYKYPQATFPYDDLRAENARRDRRQTEYELEDTGIFADSRYFDVTAEYAKRSPNDILIRLTVANRGPQAAALVLLPTLWFRNTWIWGCRHEGCWRKPDIRPLGDGPRLKLQHESLGTFYFEAEPAAGADGVEYLFTENETNTRKLWGTGSYTDYVKDAFHRCVIDGEDGAVNPDRHGTKVAVRHRFDLEPGEEVTVRCRLAHEDEAPDAFFGDGFAEVFSARRDEQDAFYAARAADHVGEEEWRLVRQAWAGLLWSKQFYHYIVRDWLAGDTEQPPPPEQRKHGRNADWRHVYARDVLPMPDKWEYPWFASWDHAFHLIAMAHVDPEYAKKQLILLLREWYMHPNGQVPAYEFAFDDVNPPVQAWCAWRLYKMTAPRGERDTIFLRRCFQKLMLNFTWWINRKDPEGNNVFGGGFLGMDNIGVIDRSKPLPHGHTLRQADATAWVAFFCSDMLAMAIELAQTDPASEDIASKFFEHYVAIADAMNTLGEHGLWDEQDGFYYDQLAVDGQRVPLRSRSLVGLIPLLAVEVLHGEDIEHLEGFSKRMRWFIEHRQDLARQISWLSSPESGDPGHRLLAIPSRERLVRVLEYMLDESEFLSPYGVRSLSRYHAEHPFTFDVDGRRQRVEYNPGHSRTGLFGGNSNWRGPVWFPINYLLIEALERYHHFYGDSLEVECPTGSGNLMTLKEVAEELSRRLCAIFMPDGNGRRPCHGDDPRYAEDPHWCNLLLFHEFFHGDNGRGLGASHQTGWTALLAPLVLDCAHLLR